MKQKGLRNFLLFPTKYACNALQIFLINLKLLFKQLEVRFVFFQYRNFFLIGFTQCKAEQQLRGMQLQQKNT